VTDAATPRHRKPRLIATQAQIESAMDRVDIAAESSKNYLPENFMATSETHTTNANGPAGETDGAVDIDHNKTSEQIIQDKITDTVDTLTNTVISNINRLRVQLDSLEKAMLESAKATNAALSHHIKIGAAALKSAADIEAQIAGFRDTVQDTTPNGVPHETT